MDAVWTYLLIADVGSLLLMGFDKLCAKMNSERVPELWFFLISLAGAFGGVFIGMFVFRHKTGKPSFQLKMVVSAVLATSLLFLLVKSK